MCSLCFPSLPLSLPPSLPVRRSGSGAGPPQAWSKVHQRIQPPGLPRAARQGAEDTPPPTSSPLPLPLPDHLLPTPNTASHPHITHHTPHSPHLPTTTTTPPATPTETNYTVPKTHQSLPKPPNTTKTVPSTRSHGKSVHVPSSSIPTTAWVPAGKGGVAEVGVVSQHGVRKSDDIPTERRTGQAQGRPNGGPGILGTGPPGFPVGKETVPKFTKVM